MLPNEITLSVDETNDGVTTTDVDYTYRRFREYTGRTEYIHSTQHSATARDKIDFYATEAKPAGNFCGVRRSSFKLTKDKTVVGRDGVSTVTSPIITEIKQSAPVGVTSAELMIERQKALAMIDNDSLMEPLTELSEV